MRTSFITLVCALTVASQSTHAETVIVRDTIGCGVDGNACTSTLTDELPGASAVTDIPSGIVGSPGSQFISTESGILDEAKFVVFFTHIDSTPVNDLSFAETYHLTFNLWTDGIQSGLDSHAVNPSGTPLFNGPHLRLVVNDALGLDITTFEVLGHTGPPGDEFRNTTFLVTVDLSSFAIEIEAEREYVFNIISDLRLAPEQPVGFRLSGSSFQDGSEDVWFTSNEPTVVPGFIQTQQGASFQLFGTFLSINTDSADFDTDNDVDGADFLAWQRGFGTMGGATKAQGDANDDFNVDAADLAVWQNQYGNVTSPLSASTTVPEPGSAVLMLVAMGFFYHRGHRGHRERKLLSPLCPSVPSVVPLFALALFMAVSSEAHAAIVVQRDSIGVDSSLTDELPGASAGVTTIGPPGIFSPGVRFAASNDGVLNEAKFVIFVADEIAAPVNDPAFFDTFHLVFNLWTDGIQNGLDSFANNPAGEEINGHVLHVVNDDIVGGLDFSSIEVFGHTGPAGDEFKFTTFLVTVDLSSFDIPVEMGREYVFNIIQDIDRTLVIDKSIRLSGSRFQDGTEDAWFTINEPTVIPGFLQTQHNSGFELFGTFLSINTDSADFDTDNDVDGADFLAWQRGFGTMGGATKSQGDANDDFNVDAADLAVWQNQYGNVTSPLSASTTVPEPTTLLLACLAGYALLQRRRRI